MAQNFVSSEVFWNRAPAQPHYSGEWSSRYSAAITASDNPVVTTAIPFVVDQRPGAGWLVEVVGVVHTSTDAYAQIATIAGINGWFIDGVYTDNGSYKPIDAITTIGIGRNTTQYRLAFHGDARTAILALAGDPDLVDVEIRYRPERKFKGYWQGYATFGEFATVPPNTIPANQNANYIGATQFVDQMLTTFSEKNVVYNRAPVGSTPAIVNECAFSAIDVTGFVIIEPGDVGVGPGQIPANVADNTAERFRYHPNTFFRNTEYIKGVAVRSGDDISVSTTSAGQPVGIYVNESPLVDSRWLVIIDGEVQVINLHVSTLLPIMTPLQLWQNIWVPLIQGSESTASSVEFNTSMKLNRLRFLHYARCLDRAGTATTQTNTSQG